MQKSNVLNIADIHFYKKKKKPAFSIHLPKQLAMHECTIHVNTVHLKFKKKNLFMSIKIMINELQRPCCNEIIKVVSPASTVLTPGVY